MKPHLYFNRAGEPVDLFEWAREFEDPSRVLARSHVKGRRGEVIVSTVWIGIPAFGAGRPMIFESMVFELRAPRWNDVIGEWEDDLEQWRYADEREALDGHEQLCRLFG